MTPPTPSALALQLMQTACVHDPNDMQNECLQCLRASLTAVRQATLEECAKLADAHATTAAHYDSPEMHIRAAEAEAIAGALRTLHPPARSDGD